MSATEVSTLARLVERFDPELFWPMREDARLRLLGGPDGERDVVFEGDRAFLVAPAGRPDALLSADAQAWTLIASDVRGGLDAFRTGRLRIRRDLHLGVGFLAATADTDPARPGRLRFAQVPTAAGSISINEAGSGAGAVDGGGGRRVPALVLTPRGRAAFYAAARNIYLEEPYGPRGLWTRLPTLAPPALFVWGRQDHIVPIGFAQHVAQALPAAHQLELDCGHVPQLEAPAQTHAALREFLAGARDTMAP